MAHFLSLKNSGGKKVMLKRIFIILIIFFIPGFLIGENQKIKNERAKEKVLLNLKKEYQWLKLWETRLNEQEKRLKRIELQILTNQEEIEKIQKQISNLLAQIKQIRDANVSQLALVYSKMKPQDAAGVVDNMPTTLAVKIFLKMQPNKVAKILNLVNREKAIAITEKLALYGIKINLKGK